MSASDLVDVVDADDVVVGRATRAEVRAGNLRHRACYIVALDSTGRVFVHLRTSTKDVFPSHFDAVVGGVLAAGESYEDGAGREVREELGVAPRGLKKIGALRYDDSSNRVMGEIFECWVSPPLTLQTDEIVSGEWLTVEEVERLAQSQLFCPDGLVAFRIWQRAGPG